MIYVPMCKNCGTYFRNFDLLKFLANFFKFKISTLSPEQQQKNHGELGGYPRSTTEDHGAAVRRSP